MSIMVSIPRRKAHNKQAADPSSDEFLVSIPRRKAHNLRHVGYPVCRHQFPSLVGRLTTSPSVPSGNTSSTFPSLVGRLTTAPRQGVAPREPQFPSLVGRLTTGQRCTHTGKNGSVSIPRRKAHNFSRVKTTCVQTLFPSLVGRLTTRRDVHHTRFSVG